MICDLPNKIGASLCFNLALYFMTVGPVSANVASLLSRPRISEGLLPHSLHSSYSALLVF
jgi:hypothetical protein